MAEAPDVDEVVDLIARTWAGPGAVTDGFRFEGARAVEGAIEIGFRWRRDPQRYLVRFDHADRLAEARGERFDAGNAVAELGWWLMEELDTGFVGRADRRTLGDAVLLIDRPHVDDGWFVGRVPLRVSPGTLRRAAEAMAATGERFAVVGSWGDAEEPIADPGRFLDRAGLDGSSGRGAAADGSLVAWLQIDRGDGRSPKAGQAVVVRVDGTTARIARLEVRSPDPRALEDLALAACRAAIEEGAEVLVADRGLRELLPFGFVDDGERLVARHDEVRSTR